MGFLLLDYHYCNPVTISFAYRLVARSNQTRRERKDLGREYLGRGQTINAFDSELDTTALLTSYSLTDLNGGCNGAGEHKRECKAQVVKEKCTGTFAHLLFERPRCPRLLPEWANVGPTSPYTPLVATPASAMSLTHVTRLEQIEAEIERRWAVRYAAVRCVLDSQCTPLFFLPATSHFNLTFT